jgi:hypothetical protein
MREQTVNPARTNATKSGRAARHHEHERTLRHITAHCQLPRPAAHDPTLICANETCWLPTNTSHPFTLPEVTAESPLQNYASVSQMKTLQLRGEKWTPYCVDRQAQPDFSMGYMHVLCMVGQAICKKRTYQ